MTKPTPIAESATQAEIRLALGSRSDCRIWRNTVAQGVMGDVTWVRTPTTVRVHPGDAVVRHARVLHAGLAEGSPDLIGLRTIVITPEMIGESIAAFVGVEVKSDAGRQSMIQKSFMGMLTARGALAGVARSVIEANIILEFPVLPF